MPRIPYGTPGAAAALTARRASWWYQAGKNLRVARGVASRTLGGNTGLGSISRWAMAGAGLGAIRGAADNVIGEDRVSVLGGAIQGAVTLGGLRAMRVAFNSAASKKVAAGSMAAGGTASTRAAMAARRGVYTPGRPLSGAAQNRMNARTADILRPRRAGFAGF